MNEPSTNRGLLYGIIAATVIVFAGLAWLIIKAPSEPAASLEPQDENVTFHDNGAPNRGPVAASEVKATVHIYGDLQCPACKAQEAVFSPIMDEYQNKGVRFVWKDFPLTTIHPNARGAADAARCSQDQGWFWSYRKALYDYQSDWESLADPKPYFLMLAKASKMDYDKFAACLASNPDDAKVAADIAEATANGVDRTPTFFVNKKRYYGLTTDQWKQVLDKAIATASSTGSGS